MASEEFSDISHLAIAMLSTKGFAKEIVEMAEKHSSTFLVVADLLMQSSCPRFRSSSRRNLRARGQNATKCCFKRNPGTNRYPFHEKIETHNNAGLQRRCVLRDRKNFKR